MTETIGVTVDLAEERDLPAILTLSNWAAANTPANFALEPEPLADWEQSFAATRARYPWLVARADGNVAGFAKASPHRARGAYLWTAEVSVYVDHHVHGRGVGRALYHRLIPLLRAQGYVTLLAGITTPNPASERLHEAFGFRRCGSYDRAGWKFGRWHDVGYWQCHLHPEGAAPSPPRPVAEVWPDVDRESGT